MRNTIPKKNTNLRFSTEEYYEYRVVNLVTGETIIPEKESYLLYEIEIAGGYFVADTDLYQFMDNGDIICVVENDPALTVSILQDYFEKRGINALVKGDDINIEIDYKPYIREKFADPDLSGAFNDLPPGFNIPFEREEPFYRDHRDFLNASLAIEERKYLLHFSDKKTGGRAMGIYNETKGEWEIWPRFTAIHDDETEEFFYIISITQTNNPHLYRVGFSNDELGWGKSLYVSGGIYSVSEGEFITDLHLYEDYPPRSGTILTAGWSYGERAIKFPRYGVYYRDYGRITAQDDARK